MGDGTKENPYTWEDIVRLIDENRSSAQPLTIFDKYFEEGIILSDETDGISINLAGAALNSSVLKGAVFDKCHLEEIRLMGASLEGAWFEDAHLERANLSGAKMQNAHFEGANLEGARLTNAHLEGAVFFDANLKGAKLNNAFTDGTRLSGAHLEGAWMQNVKYTDSTEMESVDWGNHILGEEKEGEKTQWLSLLKSAEEIYRRLKIWYTEHGDYTVAAKFYYREKEANRKSLKWNRKSWNHRLAREIFRALFGYGEHWERIIIWIAGVILGLASLYFLINDVWSWGAFWRSLYFSGVSFTALGYGSWINSDWIDINNDIIRGLGVAESFLGVSMMALVLVIFVRKWTR